MQELLPDSCNMGWGIVILEKAMHVLPALGDGSGGSKKGRAKLGVYHFGGGCEDCLGDRILNGGGRGGLGLVVGV